MRNIMGIAADHRSAIIITVLASVDASQYGHMRRTTALVSSIGQDALR